MKRPAHATAEPEPTMEGAAEQCYQGTRAHQLCDLYETATFDAVHRRWSKHLPRRPGLALDVGAGSGRDAAALAKRGWHVIAVDCSADMLSEAQSRHPNTGIQWVHDALPTLDTIKGEHERFTFILCSAVWMHLAPAERETAMRTMSELLDNGGKAVITLRHPPDPTRHMFDVSAAETIALAKRNDLTVLQATHTADPISDWQRHDVSWSTVVLQRPNPRRTPTQR